MTDSGKSARDKATDRLAAILRGTALDGASQTLADTEVAGASFLNGERSWVGWCARANAMLDALGLVAIDPALVERYAKANEGWEQPWPEGAGPGGPHAESVHAALAAAAIPLADAVLAQLRAKP